MNKFMNLAYKDAIKARDIDEVPIGAVIVKDNKVKKILRFSLDTRCR